MFKKAITGAILLAIVCGLALSGSMPAFAVGISPVKYDNIKLNPGESAEREMIVTNNRSATYTYYFKALNFTAGDNEDGLPSFQDEQIGLSQWISTDVDSITIEPGEQRKVKIIIDVPMDAEPGGHFASLFVTLNPPSEDDFEQGVGLGSNLGLLLLVHVNGDINEDSELLEFGIVEEKTKGNRLPTTFYTRTKNSGTVHFKPRGTIDIYNMIGRKSESVPANPLGGNVLPKSVRRLEARWLKSEDHNTDGGFFKELSNEWHNFALGRYKAVLNMEWSATQEPLTGTVTFWVFPWRVLLVALIIIVILLSGLKGYNKMIINSAKR